MGRTTQTAIAPLEWQAKSIFLRKKPPPTETCSISSENDKNVSSRLLKRAGQRPALFVPAQKTGLHPPFARFGGAPRRGSPDSSGRTSSRAVSGDPKYYRACGSLFRCARADCRANVEYRLVKGGQNIRRGAR